MFYPESLEWEEVLTFLLMPINFSTELIFFPAPLFRELFGFSGDLDRLNRRSNFTIAGAMFALSRSLSLSHTFYLPLSLPFT